MTGKKRKRKLRKGRAALAALMLLVVCAGIFIAAGGGEKLFRPPDQEISIICAGDVIVHYPQLWAAEKSDGSYDFSENFMEMAPYFEAADLSIVNCEITFGGEPYSGYPMFSTPDVMAQNLKEAGFDVALTANNHVYDSGEEGMDRTLDVLKGSGLMPVGTRYDESDKRYIIVNVQSEEKQEPIPIAIVNYTYESPEYLGQKTMNCIAVSDSAADRINSFNEETLSEDLAQVKEDIHLAREEGAIFVIVCYHWGTEYEEVENHLQEEIAERTVAMGADIIFGSHPHVAQPMVMMDSEKVGHKVPVFYSTGNFISNQQEYLMGNTNSERGIVGRVKIVYNERDGIMSIKAGYIPVWVDRYRTESGWHYTVVPLTDKGMDNSEALEISGHRDRAETARDALKEIMGK